MAKSDRPYREVRALERGLALLDAMAELGWAAPSALALRAGIDRSSAYRLLATIATAGFAVRRADGYYYLAPRLQQMGAEMPQPDLEIQIAQEELNVLVQQIGWPSDYAVVRGGRLTIVASTHWRTTMTTFRKLLGQHRPIMRAALGRAMLGAMHETQLAETLALVRAAGGSDALEIDAPDAIALVIDRVRKDGFGGSHGQIEPGTSAIALPVRRASRVVGAANIVFFSSVLTPATAASRLLLPLSECVGRIERRFAGLQ